MKLKDDSEYHLGFKVAPRLQSILDPLSSVNKDEFY